MAEDVLAVQRRLADLLARHTTAAAALVDPPPGAVAEGLWRDFLDAWPGLSTLLPEEGAEAQGRVLALALGRLAERHEAQPAQLQLLASLLGACLEAGLLTIEQLGTEPGSLFARQGGAGQMLCRVLADFAPKGMRPEGQTVVAQLWKAGSQPAGPEAAAAAEQAVQQVCLGLAPYLVGQQAAEAGAVPWQLEGSVASARERRRHLAELLAVAGRGQLLPLVDVCTVWWWTLDDRGCLAPPDTLPTGWALPEQQQAAEWLLDRLLAQRHVDAALEALHPRHAEPCHFLQVLGRAMGRRIQAAARAPATEGWVWGLLADQLLALGGEPATCEVVGVAFRSLHRTGVKSNWVVWLAAQACLVPCIRQLMLSPADPAATGDREGGLGLVLVEVVLGCAEDGDGKLLGPPGLMVECLHQRLLADTRQGPAQLHDTLKRAYQGCRVYGLAGGMAGHYRAVDEQLGLLEDPQLLLPPAWPLLAAVACVNTQKVSGRLWSLLAEQGTVAHRIPGQGPGKLAGQGAGLAVELLEQLPPYVQLRLARALQDWLAADRTRDNGRLAPGAVETYARLHGTARAYLGRCMLLHSPPVDFAHKLLEDHLRTRPDERAGDSHWAAMHMLVELLTWRLGPFLAQYPTKLTRMLFTALYQVGTSEPVGRPRQLLVALEGLVASTLHTVPNKALVVMLSVWEQWPARGGTNPATDLLQHHMRHLLRHLAQAVARQLAVPGWLLYDPATVQTALGQPSGDQADLGRDTALGRRCQGLLQGLQGLDWAPEAAAYLPPPIKAFCRPPTNPTGRAPLDHQAWASQQTALVAAMLQGDLGARLQQLARDDMVLCVGWLGLLANKGAMGGPLGRNVAGALRLVAVQQHYACTERLMDHIVATTPEGGWGPTVELLEGLLFDGQLLLLAHVLLALAQPTHSGKDAQRRLGLAVALLLGPGFNARADCCVQLGIHPRAWLEADWPARHEAYHQRYPEVFDLADPGPQRPQRDGLPVYYTNTVLRVLPAYALLLGRLVEANMEEALLALLARHPALVKMDVAPVRLVYSLLATYHSAPALSPRVRTALLAPLAMQGLPADAGPQHYSQLVARLAAELGQTVASTDGRFEAADPRLLALQRAVVELLGGHGAQAVGDGLVGALLQPTCAVGAGAYVGWINTVALLLAHSPTAVRSQLFAQLVHAVATDKELLAHEMGAVDSCPNLARWHPGMRRWEQLLALGQATLLHGLQHGTSAAAYDPSMLWAGQLPSLLATVHGSGVVVSEQQLLALCLLVGPSLRLLQPGPAQRGEGQAGELLLLVFELLAGVDAAKQRLYGHYPWPSPATDRVLDFMYHIRYTYACPDSVYQRIASKLGRLDRGLQARLHFMRRSRS